MRRKTFYFYQNVAHLSPEPEVFLAPEVFECVCGSAESLCFYQSKFRGKHLISPGTGSGSGKNISAAPGSGGGADKLPHHINTDNPQLMAQWPDQSITTQL